MARRCVLTGKIALVGHRVSHANNKTKHRFLPNLQRMTVWSDALGQTIRLRISVNGLRTIEHKGGIDSCLQGTRNGKLLTPVRRLKRKILSALSQAK